MVPRNRILSRQQSRSLIPNVSRDILSQPFLAGHVFFVAVLGRSMPLVFIARHSFKQITLQLNWTAKLGGIIYEFAQTAKNVTAEGGGGVLLSASPAAEGIHLASRVVLTLPQALKACEIFLWQEEQHHQPSTYPQLFDGSYPEHPPEKHPPHHLLFSSHLAWCKHPCRH